MVKEWHESNDPFYFYQIRLRTGKPRTQLAQGLLSSKNITKYTMTDYLIIHGEVCVMAKESPSITQDIFPDVIRVLSINLACCIYPGFGLIFCRKKA